ncbi:hypothetical protein EYV94_09885 [Puteibacter caeruleilacunae]|nr:hypothetical protein EYV94_09885 [Puteibacter caeruleilacunae]
MKRFILLFVIFLSLKAAAESENAGVLKIVLSDSIVCNYMDKISEIDITDFMLFKDEGNYSFQAGDMEFEEHGCKEMPPCSGFIKKNIIRRDKAVVKIYFKGKEDFIAKVKLVRDASAVGWHIQSRLLYRSFTFPRKKRGLIYYNYHKSTSVSF